MRRAGIPGFLWLLSCTQEPTSVAFARAAVRALRSMDVTVPGPSGPSAYAAVLEALDPAASASIIPALRAFAEHHSAPGVDEAERLTGLLRLLALLEGIVTAVQARMQTDSAFADAVMRAIGEASGSTLASAAAHDAIARLERDGLRFYRVDGELVHVDPVVLERLAAPGLSAAATLYLQAVLWDREHTARMAGDDPDDLVRSIEQWEQLIDLGPPYASAARSRASVALELYLMLCLEHFDESPRCRITAAMQDSYRRFVREHPTSRFTASVVEFVGTASRRRFSPTTDEAIESTARALTRIASERPSPGSSRWPDADDDARAPRSVGGLHRVRRSEGAEHRWLVRAPRISASTTTSRSRSVCPTT